MDGFVDTDTVGHREGKFREGSTSLLMGEHIRTGLEMQLDRNGDTVALIVGQPAGVRLGCP